MRAYQTIKLTEFPDVYDMRCEARNSRTGMLSRHTVNDRPRVKRARRRALKRADKARALRDALSIERDHYHTNKYADDMAQLYAAQAWYCE